MGTVSVTIRLVGALAIDRGTPEGSSCRVGVLGRSSLRQPCRFCFRAAAGRTALQCPSATLVDDANALLSPILLAVQAFPLMASTIGR
jgi:hypothetical protein